MKTHESLTPVRETVNKQSSWSGKFKKMQVERLAIASSLAKRQIAEGLNAS